MNTIVYMLAVTIATASAVSIQELRIPRAVEVGSENVVLDCNYDYDVVEEAGLEVKWYFNHEPAPFFQWIAGLQDSQPQLIDARFQGKIDLDFTGGATNYTKYRALMLHSPSVDMAGTYTCKVSSLLSEAVEEAEMLVYAPASASAFRQQRVEDRVNVSCEFNGIYPLPSIKITWGSFALFEDSMVVTPRGNTSFDVLIHKTLEHSELPAETVFGCELSIPGTEYLVREEAIYHHRGRRSLEMEKIRELEASRQRKSKQSVYYNLDSRIEVGEIGVMESNTTTIKSSLPLILILIIGSFF